ncbi:uncharacterized protein LOC124689219 [Lolium rigidum]|uniref:uncharacterized protein LOC124689219 n=1 Tax=Lolium rigidum TaxID=89674 RepID=UPI001F5D4819|nr:uncharacterized protein LOC124689219 [Lolium rigidum]
MLRERSAEAFAAAAAEEVGARLYVADFFARAFALAGDVEAFANALVHNHSSTLDSTNPILKKSKINDIRGLQNLAKSLSGQRSVQAQSAEYTNFHREPYFTSVAMIFQFFSCLVP